MKTIKDKQNSGVFPWIEVDTHPFMGSTNLIGIDVPRLRIYKRETEKGIRGYFIFFEHNTFENHLVIKSGTLKEADIYTIFDKITKSGFFEMDDTYEEAIIDGGTRRIIVQQDGRIKTVRHLRYTARHNEKMVPVEFTNLHDWLIEFTTSKCLLPNVFKIQPLEGI